MRGVVCPWVDELIDFYFSVALISNTAKKEFRSQRDISIFIIYIGAIMLIKKKKKKKKVVDL